MSVKKISIHALLSAVLAIAAALVYNTVYSKALAINFDKILNVGGIIGATTFGCALMAIAYYLAYKWKLERFIGALNILILVLSFASIIGVLGFKLPLDVESPELFPGLAVPMHFFPALAFFSLVPFFKYEKRHSQDVNFLK